MKKLSLEMLPAAEGDSLLLTYGDTIAPRYVLIDGGRRYTYRHLRERILQIPTNEDGERFFELLIVTHIDADHIEGVICLLQDTELNCTFGDIWFNDWNHLEPLVEGETPSHLGAAQGEFLGALLHARRLPWNEKFEGGAVVLPPEPGTLPRRDFADGLRLTIVSPTVDALIKLREEWTSVIEAAGFKPGNHDEALQQFADKAWTRLPKNLGDEELSRSIDHSEANGSSIAVLAEYEGLRLLLSGDAWPQVLRPTLDRWRAEQACPSERVALDAFKMPHHGSIKNVTPQLMNIINCRKYLISTSGSRFHHPDVDAIKMIIAEHNGSAKPELFFNYRSQDNDFWENRDDCSTAYDNQSVLAFEFTEEN
jgi:hypothetical protein